MPLQFLTETLLLGIPLLRWLLGALVTVLVLSILHFVRRTVRRRLAARERPSHFRPDLLLLTVLATTRNWAILALAVYAGFLILAADPVTAARVQQVFVLVLLVQLAFWGTTAIDYLRDEYGRQEELDGSRRTSLAALSFVGRLVLYTLVLLLALDNLGISITALIAGLGVGSLAVALAVQGILGDLFASLSIVFDKPFEIGDFIVVDDMSGTVEHIGLRTTRIRSLSGEQLVFSNNDLLASRIRNYKRMAERRVLFTINVEYGTPREKLELVPGLIREIIENIPKTRFDRSHFSAFGPHSLDFETVYYVLSREYNEYMDIQQDLNLKLYQRFVDLDIPFAFPTQTIDLRPAEPPVQA